MKAIYVSDLIPVKMAPQKRERKQPVLFDPHPPGSKHKMMSERSRKTKGKKKIKKKMEDFRAKKADMKGSTKKSDELKAATKKNVLKKSVTKKSASKK